METYPILEAIINAKIINIPLSYEIANVVMLRMGLSLMLPFLLCKSAHSIAKYHNCYLQNILLQLMQNDFTFPLFISWRNDLQFLFATHCLEHSSLV